MEAGRGAVRFILSSMLLLLPGTVATKGAGYATADRFNNCRDPSDLVLATSRRSSAMLSPGEGVGAAGAGVGAGTVAVATVLGAEAGVGVGAGPSSANTFFSPSLSISKSPFLANV